jgi:hypothetical protein
VNWSALDVDEVPDGVVAVMSTDPADSPGVTAVICVAESTVKLVAAVPPKSTEVVPTKLDPVIVTEVPPETGPPFGLAALTVGAPW